MAQLDKNAKFSITRWEDGKRMEPQFPDVTVHLASFSDSDNQMWRVAVTGQREVTEAGKKVTVDVVRVQNVGTGQFLAAMDPNAPYQEGLLPLKVRVLDNQIDAGTARYRGEGCTEWYLHPTGAPDSYLVISLALPSSDSSDPEGKVLVPFAPFFTGSPPLVVSKWVDLSAPPAEVIWRFRAWG